MFRRSFIAFVLLLATSQAFGLEIKVDSDLKDWLASQPTGNSANDWTPIPGKNIKYMVDDQTGTSGYLNPGYGGQAYDAEAIYVDMSGGYINIAIVTGRDPDAGGYVAGDIAIDFGINGTFDIGLVTLGDGVGLGGAGELYSVTEWNYGLWSDPGIAGDPSSTEFGLAHPTTVKSGNKLGAAEISYAEFTFDNDVGLGLGEFGDAGKHYVIEASISLDLIDSSLSAEAFLVHWTMACANDYVQVDPPGGAVPAPAPLGLMLLGLLPLLRRRSRRA